MSVDWEQEEAKAQSRSTVTASYDYGGDTCHVKAEVPTRGELNEIENRFDGDSDVDKEKVATEVVREYKLKPETSVDDMEVPRTLAMYLALQQEWLSLLNIEELGEQMPLQGNR